VDHDECGVLREARTFASVSFYPPGWQRYHSVKGKQWYPATDVAQVSADKGFSGGGRLIAGRERRAVLDALAPMEGSDVLEIACGTGRFTVMCAERGADIIGLDISGAMLAQGRRKARSAGVAGQVDFVRGDAARLPFPDDSFDTVFAMRFFHLADTPAAYLSEMRRVARENVFFDTFNNFSARTAYNWALPMGSRLYTRGGVEKLISDASLTLVEADHDFLLPYGFYRKIPRAVADPLRSLDTAVGDTGVGDRTASVSFWRTEV
jgi:SAM-dependent methyltransferase